MSKADIQIYGKAYSVACAPGREARLEALAGQLDVRVRRISEAVGDIGEERLLLVAALALLDEIDTIKRENPAERRAAAALADAAARIDAVAARIEAAT